jgi:hypothetical protein
MYPNSRSPVTAIYKRLLCEIVRWLAPSKWMNPIFGPKQILGKRGRGAAGKPIVFGIFKRQDKVYTETILSVNKKTITTNYTG